MSKPLTSIELDLISKILEEASDEFSNHNCNDYILPNTKENRKLLIEMTKSCLDEQDQKEEIEEITSAKGKKIYTTDWLLMTYLSKRCKEAAK